MRPDPITVRLLQSGFQARQGGRLDEARAHLQQALQRAPEQPDALYLLGEMAQVTGDLEAAAVWLERAVRSHAAQPLAWCRLGEVRESLLQHEPAIVAYRKALKLRPDLGLAHYSLARLLAARGQALEARASLNAALSQTGTPPPLRSLALQLLAQLQEAARNLTGALESLDRALALTPERAALHHNRGAVLNQLSRPSEALAAFQQADALGLAAADLHYNRGNSLQALGRQAEAMAAYRAALEIQPLHELALYDLARLRWRQGDEGFDAELQQAFAQHPESAPIAGLIGRLMLKAERFEAARQAFERACQLDGAQAGLFDGLGQALARLGRPADALAAHSRAAALAPANTAVRVGLIAACLQAGQTESAQAAVEAAQALDPDDQHVWALQGVLWRVAGDVRQAWLDDHARFVQVLDLPAPPGYADMAAFNAALEAELSTQHLDKRAPIDQTLRTGSQTHGNLLDQPGPAVALLRQRLAEGIDAYLAHLARLPPRGAERHPLLARLGRGWRFSDSWSSRLRSGGFHTSHVHPHGWISASYYVVVPPAVAQPPDTGLPPGWITFGRPDLTVPGHALTVQHAVQPVVGRLVLFPSYVWHDTVPFFDPGPRLTVAFDVLPGP